MIPRESVQKLLDEVTTEIYENKGPDCPLGIWLVLAARAEALRDVLALEDTSEQEGN